MATETIRKGWLYTREGEKFIPYTLVENVTTRSGKSYDEHVREYLSNLNTSLTQKINNIKTEVDSNGKDYDEAIAALQSKDTSHDSDITALKNKTQYFDGSASDKFFIIDNNENVVAYIDGTGVHSIDFINGAGKTFNQIVEQLLWFNGEGSDAFYFIDNNENVVAYIDKEGMHATAYSGKAGENAFYLVDDSSATDPKVAVRMDESGVLALDFTAQGQQYTLVGLNAKVAAQDTAIAANKTAIESNDADILALQTAAAAMEDNLEEYYGYNNFGQDTFYFIDNSTDPKVGTMVNAAGITTTNITFANEKNAKENMMFFEKLGTINITI